MPSHGYDELNFAGTLLAALLALACWEQVADPEGRTIRALLEAVDPESVPLIAAAKRETLPSLPKKSMHWLAHQLRPAFERPLTAAEFAQIQDELQRMQQAGADYLSRQAFLSWSVLNLEGIWPPDTKTAIAYLTVIIGMHDHGY